jgi:hypothetical protein
MIPLPTTEKAYEVLRARNPGIDQDQTSRGLNGQLRVWVDRKFLDQLLEFRRPSLRDFRSREFGDNSKRDVDFGSDSARGKEIAIAHKPLVFARCSNQRHRSTKARCVAARRPFGHPAAPRSNGTHIDRDHILGAGALDPDEFKGLLSERPHDAWAAGPRKVASWKNPETAITQDRCVVLATTCVRACANALDVEIDGGVAKRLKTSNGPVKSSCARSGKITKPTLKSDMSNLIPRAPPEKKTPPFWAAGRGLDSPFLDRAR